MGAAVGRQQLPPPAAQPPHTCCPSRQIGSFEPGAFRADGGSSSLPSAPAGSPALASPDLMLERQTVYEPKPTPPLERVDSASGRGGDAHTVFPWHLRHAASREDMKGNMVEACSSQQSQQTIYEPKDSPGGDHQFHFHSDQPEARRRELLAWCNGQDDAGHATPGLGGGSGSIASVRLGDSGTPPEQPPDLSMPMLAVTLAPHAPALTPTPPQASSATRPPAQREPGCSTQATAESLRDRSPLSKLDQERRACSTHRSMVALPSRALGNTSPKLSRRCSGGGSMNLSAGAAAVAGPFPSHPTVPVPVTIVGGGTSPAGLADARDADVAEEALVAAVRGSRAHLAAERPQERSTASSRLAWPGSLASRSFSGPLSSCMSPKQTPMRDHRGACPATASTPIPTVSTTSTATAVAASTARSPPLQHQQPHVSATSHKSAAPGGGTGPTPEQTPRRGPERFFYDTSSYTGVARYGGPSVRDAGSAFSPRICPTQYPHAQQRARRASDGTLQQPSHVGNSGSGGVAAGQSGLSTPGLPSAAFRHAQR